MSDRDKALLKKAASLPLLASLLFVTPISDNPPVIPKRERDVLLRRIPVGGLPNKRIALLYGPPTNYERMGHVVWVHHPDFDDIKDWKLDAPLFDEQMGYWICELATL